MMKIQLREIRVLAIYLSLVLLLLPLITASSSPIVAQSTSATNLALGRPAVASSIERFDLSARNAVDGDLMTRWSSRQGIDPQWIYVDLGQPSTIAQVVLRWETAFAESYRIEFSNDAVNWTEASFQEAKNGGVDIVSVSGTARYVRMYGLTRGHSGFGYSLYEMEVYDQQAFEPPSEQERPDDPVPGPYTMFFDDFEDGVDPNWIFRSGTSWKIVDGALEINDPCGGDFGSTKIGDNSWTDYEVQFDFKGMAGSGKSFLFRWGDSAASAYAWSARSLEDDMVLQGGDQPTSFADFQFQNGVWYRVKIQVKGEHIQIYVDGKLLLDETHEGTQLLSGGVGPVLNSGTVNCPFRVQYDNVIVNENRFVDSSVANEAANLAKAVVGKPYLLGAKGFDFGERVYLNPEEIDQPYKYYNAATKVYTLGQGLDCSGLVMWSYNVAGNATKYLNNDNPIYYEGASGQFHHNTQPISEDDLRPGDLLFFNIVNNSSGTDHVAMYVGDEGEYDVIHASSPGAGIIWDNKDSLEERPGFDGFRRPVSPKVEVEVQGLSPIDLAIIDPEGYTITADTLTVTELEYLREISGELYYSESDLDGDGDLDDVIYAPELKMGDYVIEVIPEPDASPTDTYDLVIQMPQSTIVLAQDTLVENIPDNGYGIRYTGAEIVEFTPVAIDVKPGSAPNYVSCMDAAEIIEVAILSSETFDATQVDHTSVRFNGGEEIRTNDQTGEQLRQEADIDNDGDVDLVFHFRFGDTDLNCESTTVTLTGKTFADTNIKGTDYILANEAPIANPKGSYLAKEGDQVLFDGSDSVDPDEDPLVYEWDFGSGETGSGSTPPHTYADNGEYVVTLTVTDPGGLSDSKTTTATITNVEPIVEAGSNQTVEEAGMLLLSATTFADPGSLDTHIAFIDWGDDTPLETGMVNESGGSGYVSGFHIYDDNGIYTVIVTVCDDDNGCSDDSFTVSVSNVAPIVGPITAPIDPVQADYTVNAIADFTDPGILDTHTTIWDWGDGNTSVGVISEYDGSGSAIGSHTYAVPGVYTVKVTVTDKDGDSDESTYQYVVIYDPEDGFVTGGGWIYSPPGACNFTTCTDTTMGKATFGFVSKYKKGAQVPTGNTQFQFIAGNLTFRSEVYDWLVVAGSHAKFKGSGTINGGGNYGFMITATDGQINGGGDVDGFRIKIWDKDNGDIVVYDNKMGEDDDSTATTALGGGAIVIHKK